MRRRAAALAVVLGMTGLTATAPASPVGACVLPAGMDDCTFFCGPGAVAVAVVGREGAAEARCGTDAVRCDAADAAPACEGHALRATQDYGWFGVCTANGAQGVAVCASV